MKTIVLYLGSFILGAGINCYAQTGACCLKSTCLEITHVACDNQNPKGDWLGAGTTCIGLDGSKHCRSRVCCLSSGGCRDDVSQVDCMSSDSKNKWDIGTCFMCSSKPASINVESLRATYSE